MEGRINDLESQVATLTQFIGSLELRLNLKADKPLDLPEDKGLVARFAKSTITAKSINLINNSL